MSPEQVRKRIGEYRRIRKEPGNDRIALVEAALFVEEVFSLTLTDEEIDAETLGTFAAMEKLVIEKTDRE